MGADTLRITWVVTRDFLLLVLVGCRGGRAARVVRRGPLVGELRLPHGHRTAGLRRCGMVVLLIAAFTVSFRAIRAAQTDPVRALRHE
jgi:hypothetical protein